MSPQVAARKYGIAHDVDLTEIMVPFIKCETAFRRNVGKLVFRTNVFDLDFGIQVDSVKFPIKPDSVGSRHVSHRRITAVNNHLDYCIIFKKFARHRSEKSFAFDVTSSTFLRPTSVDLLDCSLRSYVGMIFRWCIAIKVAPVFWVDVKKNATLQQPNPRDQERVNRPCVALHVEQQPQIQWNCGSLLLAHPTHATECSTPEDTQDSPRGRF